MKKIIYLVAAAQQIVGFLKDGCEKFRVNK